MRGVASKDEATQSAAQKAALDQLAISIRDCRICDEQGVEVRHSSSTMRRGTGQLGMVIGIQPGKTEVASARAFSGVGGKRLIRWLIDAQVGQGRKEIFERVYFTSLAKCGSEAKDISSLVRNCRPFLTKQIRILSPKILITLGAEPLRHLFHGAQLEDWICRLFGEQEIQPSLFPILPVASKILALPHPSPLNRWPNDPENQQKLRGALIALKNFIGRT